MKVWKRWGALPVTRNVHFTTLITSKLIKYDLEVPEIDTLKNILYINKKKRDIFFLGIFSDQNSKGILKEFLPNFIHPTPNFKSNTNFLVDALAGDKMFCTCYKDKKSTQNI